MYTLLISVPPKPEDRLDQLRWICDVPTPSTHLSSIILSEKGVRGGTLPLALELKGKVGSRASHYSLSGSGTRLRQPPRDGQEARLSRRQAAFACRSARVPAASRARRPLSLLPPAVPRRWSHWPGFKPLPEWWRRRHPRVAETHDHGSATSYISSIRDSPVQTPTRNPHSVSVAADLLIVEWSRIVNPNLPESDDKAFGKEGLMDDG